MLKHILNAAFNNQRHLLLVFLSLFACSVMAKPILDSSKTPVGLWITYDSKKKTPVSMIRIINDNGIIKGTVEKILAPEYINQRCSACTGVNKNRPLLGLEILSNMRSVGGVWKDGRILDTNNGKTYSAILKLSDQDDRLEARGFLGIPLIGRSQFWTRVHETSY